MDSQRYTPEEQELFEQEVEQNLRKDVPSMREEEIKAAAQRASARELEQQRDALRGQLDDQVVAITEEPADLRAAANREAPSKLLLGIMLLLLLLFTLAVFDRLPWLANARASGDVRPVGSNDDAINAILGAGAAAGPPLASPASIASPDLVAQAPPVPAPSPSPPAVATLPQTGIDDAASNHYPVDPLFGRFYWDHGGIKRFGRATGPLMTVNGRQVQTFQYAQLEYKPEYAGTSQAMQIVPRP